MDPEKKNTFQRCLARELCPGIRPTPTSPIPELRMNTRCSTQ